MVLLHQAMTGLVVEQLTLPGVLDGEGDPDALIGALVHRILSGGGGGADGVDGA
ncbi:hypothetical protein [Nocardiopsis halophila]|uniref:hypothetical protein n=1 Tax=Nocardiopsis halophila TaxID=141692 RepID=UPI0003793EC0|nr:hypothetical protein [Nocardiopsis halophila]